MINYDESPRLGVVCIVSFADAMIFAKPIRSASATACARDRGQRSCASEVLGMNVAAAGDGASWLPCWYHSSQRSAGGPASARAPTRVSLVIAAGGQQANTD